MMLRPLERLTRKKRARAVTARTELGGHGYTTRLDTWMDLMGTKVLVLFIGLYLGVVFLLASAGVLALQQLTQAADAAGDGSA